MKIYVTRHGRTQWNDEGRLQGTNDSPLTKLGIQMAVNLSKKIEDFDIDAIVSSDLKRAKDTAKYIISSYNIPHFSMPSLREMAFGKWEGVKIEDVKSTYPKQFDDFEQDPKNYNNGSGETFFDVINRVNLALDEIKSLGYQNILIVTHGITVKALQTIMEKRSINDISKLPVIRGCTLIGYEVVDDGYDKIYQDAIYDFIPELKTNNL